MPIWEIRGDVVSVGWFSTASSVTRGRHESGGSFWIPTSNGVVRGASTKRTALLSVSESAGRGLSWSFTNELWPMAGLRCLSEP